MMDLDKTTEPIESLESWLSRKPYWERYIWKINFEKDTITNADIDQCYVYLSEHLGFIPAIPTKPNISFKNQGIVTPEVASTAKKRILEVKNFENVNALSPNCALKFGPNLTLVYGGNGSGKSGVGRLLCNACVYRGKREILPNARTTSQPSPKAKATFVMEDGEIEYTLGDINADLRRFSVFDSDSILMHLDEANTVNFTPAYLKIFDKVAGTIATLEDKLTSEKNSKKKDSPFATLFLDGVSTTTADFCRNITCTTEESDLIERATFDTETDDAKMVSLQKQIEAKKKFDIKEKKRKLAMDRQFLGVLRATLQEVVDRFSEASMKEVNQLIQNILEKEKITESLGVGSFTDGTLKTVGGTKWRKLLDAARSLYEAEKAVSGDKELTHCMLCHQKLTQEASTLFQKYWQFLESEAKSELSVLRKRQSDLLQDFRYAKTKYPKFLPTDAGVQVLIENDPSYLAELKDQYKTLGDEDKDVIGDWILKIENLQEVSRDKIPTVDLTKIDTLIIAIEDEKSGLVDNDKEINSLTTQLNELKHKKYITELKNDGLDYIAYLKWVDKIRKVDFSDIKSSITKKRRYYFNALVAKRYQEVFNDELKQLGCDFNLEIQTRGEPGSTVKEFRLDFAKNYNPSQILSEGEQNACSIADFLTEIQIDTNNCGIMFDDPVTSLDHERKNKIARRLVIEAGKRQVVVFTHDVVFMSQLADHAEKESVPLIAHWMRQVEGVPGNVEDYTSPTLSNLKILRPAIDHVIKNFTSLGADEQRSALRDGFDFLRRACEVLIEKNLFAGTIERWVDQIHVQNLEEAVFDITIALKIVDLHGRISGYLDSHNISDQKRGNFENFLSNLKDFINEFDILREELKKARHAAMKAREEREQAKQEARGGW